MIEKKVSNDFGIVFRAEHWSLRERFRTFVGERFPNNRDLHRGAKAVSDHLGKFEILASYQKPRISVFAREDFTRARELER